MKNYFEPTMNITLFDAENVVTGASDTTTKQAEEYLTTVGAGVLGRTATSAAVNKVLDFTK